MSARVFPIFLPLPLFLSLLTLTLLPCSSASAGIQRKSADSVLGALSTHMSQFPHLWEFTQRVILTLDGVSLMANVLARNREHSRIVFISTNLIWALFRVVGIYKGRSFSCLASGRFPEYLPGSVAHNHHRQFSAKEQSFICINGSLKSFGFHSRYSSAF